MNSYNTIKRQSDLPAELSGIGFYDRLKESLNSSNQRILVNIRGSREWCLKQLQQHDLFRNRIVFSNQADISDSLPFSKAEMLLGQDTRCVIYDAYSGINIDVLCMAEGLLKAGGVLVLLTAENPLSIEDEYGRWQGGTNSHRYFLKYFMLHLEQDMLVLSEQSGHFESTLAQLPNSPMAVFHQHVTAEQDEILGRLRVWLTAGKKSLFILTAERGRGKSTTLGLFARYYSDTQFVLSAASRAQVAIVLKQLDSQHDNVRFLAPDEIIRRQFRIPVLLIDEAAMLPNNMLQQCIALSDKTLISTTTGGYEGTGQGFLLKFLAGFDSTDFEHLTMREAVRWGQNDALEQWIRKVLMFGSATTVKRLDIDDITVERIDKKQLSEDEDTLRAIYSLLVSAHYRTRPSDLRQLMEDENQRVFIARSASHIVAVLLLNEEGGFDDALCQQVFMGKRRPQGHLFAQMMTAQAGVKNFAGFRGFRIQRIAVHQSCRQQGIGRLLINAAEQLAQAGRLDYLASCFAIDSAVLPFWTKTNFKLVHIGLGKGKSSGRQAIAVIRSFNPEVEEIITRQKLKVRCYLPVWLLSYCQPMFWPDVLALLELVDIKYQFSNQDRDEIMAFSEGYRGFELTQAVLQKLVVSHLRPGMFSSQLNRLLIERVLLNKGRIESAQMSGKKQQLKQLRHCIAELNSKP